MDKHARRIRIAIAGLGKRRRNEEFPARIRHDVVAYARKRRAKSASWQRIADAVALSPGTIQRWVDLAPSESETSPPSPVAAALVPVQVASAPATVPEADPSPVPEVVTEREPEPVPEPELESELERAPTLLVLVSPRGFRLEGLVLEEAAQLLAVLS